LKLQIHQIFQEKKEKITLKEKNDISFALRGELWLKESYFRHPPRGRVPAMLTS